MYVAEWILLFKSVLDVCLNQKDALPYSFKVILCLLIVAEPSQLPACVCSVRAHQPRGRDPRRVVVPGVGARRGNRRPGRHGRPRAAGNDTTQMPLNGLLSNAAPLSV